jgi:hypothetical protein
VAKYGINVEVWSMIRNSDQEFAQLKVIGMSNLLNIFYDSSACDS